MIKLIFLTAFFWSGPGHPSDSLRMETINGKRFIIHQVAERETLYAISKRYGTTIMSILEFNSTAGSGLEVGQLLKVPYIPKSTKQSADGTIHKVEPKETLFSIAKAYNVSVDDIKTWNKLKENSISVGQELLIKKKPDEVAPSINPKATTSNTHVVEAKETLFSISRKYGVTVQQLKDWNGLDGTDLKVGSTLVVASAAGAVAATTITAPASTAVVVKPTPAVNEEIKQEPKQEIKAGTGDPAKTEATIRISESVQGSDEVKEGGVAELIDGTEGNRKYLGLHRTAKPGTILKVRNEMNNREVFVRVVGPLPDTGVNNNVVIKISKSAYDRLGAIDPRFRVEVTYYK